MTKTDDLSNLTAELKDLKRRIRELETGSPLQASSVTQGRVRFIGGLLRIDSGGRVEIVGTLQIDGTTKVTGTFRVDGPWTLAGNGAISGNVTGTGTLTWNGPWNLNGPGNVTGVVNVSGDLNLSGSGRIRAGTVEINRFGPHGGQIVSSGTVLYLSANTSVIVGAEYLSTKKISATDISCFTLDTLGSKNFRMPHPTKPDHWLRHGATESPVSGTEYTGRATIGDDGSTVVTLPEYFEALNKPGNRTVQVTPVGEPFPAGAGDVTDGEVTVFGQPGREVFWLVKAERRGGDFLLEEAIPQEPTDE